MDPALFTEAGIAFIMGTLGNYVRDAWSQNPAQPDFHIRTTNIYVLPQ